MKPAWCSFQVGTIGFISPPIVAQQLSSVFLVFTCGEIEFSVSTLSIYPLLLKLSSLENYSVQYWDLLSCLQQKDLVLKLTLCIYFENLLVKIDSFFSWYL